MAAVPQLCRDCLATDATAPHPARQNGRQDGRCGECGSPRIVRHPELHDLSIAHIDCDAFYASIEKRDNPSLVNKPVIVGGGRRGVVAAACYVARLYGVRSAMPMFKALEACPDAVVIRPNMAKYREAGLKIREMMQTLTPRVQPLSIDEAFLDLSALDRQRRGSPATALARLVLRIEHDCGVSASIGLSYNKFLAKIASDLNKPRGFAVIGRAEAQAFLASKPVGLLWGVGKALQTRMRRDGLTTIGQLQHRSEAELVARYGSIGSRLFHFSRGEDDRKVTPELADQEHLGRDDLPQRSQRPRPPAGRALAALRNGGAPPPGQGARRPDGDDQAEGRGVSAVHPQPPRRRADPAGPGDLRDGRAAAAQGSDRTGLPADRRRGRRPCRGCRRRRAGPICRCATGLKPGRRPRQRRGYRICVCCLSAVRPRPSTSSG